MRPSLPALLALLALLLAACLPIAAEAAPARFATINGVPVAASGVTTRLAVGQSLTGSTTAANADDLRLGRTITVSYDNPDTEDVINTGITYQCTNGKSGNIVTRLGLQGNQVSYPLSQLDALNFDDQTTLTVPTRCTISGQILGFSSTWKTDPVNTFPNQIVVDVTPMPYALYASLKAASAGTTLSLGIFPSITFSGGPTEYAYIIAVYGNTALVLDRGNWRSYSSGPLPSAGALVDGSFSLKINLGAFDPATPLPIYIGYGSSSTDMLNNVRFQRVN